MYETTAVVKFPNRTREELEVLSPAERKEYEQECCHFLFGLCEDFFPEYLTIPVLVTYLAGTAINFCNGDKDKAQRVLLEAAAQAPFMKPHKPD